MNVTLPNMSGPPMIYDELVLGGVVLIAALFITGHRRAKRARRG